MIKINLTSLRRQRRVIAIGVSIIIFTFFIVYIYISSRSHSYIIRTRINAKDNAEMVWVSEGTFRMGENPTRIPKLVAFIRDHWNMPIPQDESAYDTQPKRQVWLDGYWIYRYEVTVAQYRAFCHATKRIMPPKPPWGWNDSQPIVNVTWDDANAYACWAGMALPSEAQWEKAARGRNGFRYPWGNRWNPLRCCNRINNTSEPSPVGRYPHGMSPYGCYDMAGNVDEWCFDWYSALYYRSAPKRNPVGPSSGIAHIRRGGSWHDNGYYCRSASRGFGSPSAACGIYYGFRCATPPPMP